MKKTALLSADQVGFYMIGITNPNLAGEVSTTIDRTFKNSLAETLTETEKAFQMSFVSMTEAILIAIQFVSIVIIVIIMAVVANTMAMTARERIGEYAVFKTLGFGGWFIAGLIFGESLFISLTGTAIGIGLTFPVAEAFHATTPVSGLVLTKIDGDARGGAALSISAVSGVAVKFMGTGEKTDALEVFHPDRLAGRILGMGDVVSLVERAQETYDAKEAERMAEKLRKNSFTLDDFLDQMQQVKKMGPLGSLMEMIPGFGGAAKQAQAAIDRGELARVEAIIRSMTSGERRSPKLIDGSRRRRIAAGSGTSPQQVNELLRQFGESQRMMKAFAEGRSPIPGLSLPGRKMKKKR